MSIIAYVQKLPPCDFCKVGGVESEAHYDIKTAEGPWANACSTHFMVHSTGLGTGKGQRLIVGDKPVDTDEDRRRKVREALEAGDMDALEEAVGDGDPADYF